MKRYSRESVCFVDRRNDCGPIRYGAGVFVHRACPLHKIIVKTNVRYAAHKSRRTRRASLHQGTFSSRLRLL